MAEAGELTFELERFEWATADRLEIVGRWQGLTGRRLGRVLLHVDAGGHRRKLTAMPGGQVPVNGERWRAAFAWPHDAVDVEGAELEIGRSLVVDLPVPRRRRRSRSDADRALREDAERRLAEERAATAAVRETLATAREEARSAMAAEAEETERLRAELVSARNEAGRVLAAERAETARLRTELSARPAADRRGEETDEAGRRMYERISRELERERATVRDLRRELDAEQSQTAEHRRSVANGAPVAHDTPVAATPAGAAARRRAGALVAARAELDPRAPYRRADAARAAAARRVPEPAHAAIRVWATRIAAVALVTALLLALVIIVTTVA